MLSTLALMLVISPTADAGGFLKRLLGRCDRPSSSVCVTPPVSTPPVQCNPCCQPTVVVNPCGGQVGTEVMPMQSVVYSTPVTIAAPLGCAPCGEFSTSVGFSASIADTKPCCWNYERLDGEGTDLSIADIEKINKGGYWTLIQRRTDPDETIPYVALEWEQDPNKVPNPKVAPKSDPIYQITQHSWCKVMEYLKTTVRLKDNFTAPTDVSREEKEAFDLIETARRTVRDGRETQPSDTDGFDQTVKTLFNCTVCNAPNFGCSYGGGYEAYMKCMSERMAGCLQCFTCSSSGCVEGNCSEGYCKQNCCGVVEQW
ncbi:hypothetical protein [Stieleria varia]|uniref:hypothetical protein n=1 Tax=Stieleria varia TaxID=2528005 RepID=UPI0011B6E3A8|nr:hypothetical protein [Stieleria varia]